LLLADIESAEEYGSAAFTLLAKQRGGPKLDFQVLFYLVTDASFDIILHEVSRGVLVHP
jgi:acetyl esterase/lipase